MIDDDDPCSPAITDYREFPERSHLQSAEEGWEEIADFALRWATEMAADRPALPTTPT